MKFLTSRVVVCAIVLGAVFCSTNVRAVVDEDDFSTLTSKAYVDSLINSNDLSEHTINGAELGNQDSYFYGVSETSGNTAAKVVEIDSITDGSGTGLVIVVQPENTHTGTISNGLTLQLNSETAAEILYNGASVTNATASVVWNGGHPSVFVFDGTHWNFVGAMYDVMGVQEGITATDTTPRTLSAANIKGIVQGTKLTGLTTSNALVSASDDVLTGIGKLQGQISAIPDYGHNMVNGASIRNENSTFYGVSSDRGTDPEKTVSIPSIDALVDGLIIVVRPAETSSVANSTLNLNNFGAKRMMYNGAPVTAEMAPIVWNTGYPSTWVYDGTSWVFAGNGHDWATDISNLASHTINGALLSNSASYFYDPAGGGAAISWEKTVSIPSITTLAAGQIITVKPSTTSGAIQPFGASRPSQMTLTLNADGRDNALAIPIIYNGNAVTGSEQSVVWNANYPSTFVYDGTNWVFMGRGYDANTEYGAISVSDGITGTDNTLHTVRADYLKQIIQGTTLTGLDTTSTAALDASDSITTAIGKLEGQKQSKIPATTSTYVYDQSTNPAADGSVVTTNTLGVTGERGIANAPTYDNNSQLTNGSWLPTVSAVSGMVSAGTPTGTPTYVATYLPHANGDPAGEGKVGGEVAIYDTANTYNASTDADKLATAGFVATKQNQIGATSDGTNNTPNYVYDATNNPTADGSVVTTGAADGTTGQRGIAKAVVSDGNGGYTNGDWLPTVNAMIGAISTATDALTWTSTETTAANNYSITFDDTTGNWPATDAGKLIDGTALANALSTKQRKITRSPLSFTSSGAVGSSATYIVPATIATSTKRSANESNEISAQTYGIMDSSTANNAEGGLKGFSTSYYQGQFPNVNPMDKFVPTVRAVALALADVDWDPIVWSNTHETLINAYSTSFAAGMATHAGNNEWAAADADKLVNGTFIANALALKQNIIPVRGTAHDTALRIVTYPQYGQSAGTIGELILDTASLYTTDNSHIPSSKLVSGLLDLELDKSLAWHMDGLDDFFEANHARVTTKNLFELVDMAQGGDSGAEVVLSHFYKHDVVPTMEVLAYALNGAYNTLENQLSINTYTTSETSSSISGGNISIPTALTLTEEYADDTKLTDTEQLFLVPWVRDNDNGAAGTAAGNLLTSYATNENIPTLDTLANALYGLYKTRKSYVDMWNDLADSDLPSVIQLYEIDSADSDFTPFFYNDSYMDAFVPTISMLWHESRGLWNLINEKQDKIPEAGYIINAGGAKVVTRSYRPTVFGGIAIPTKRNEDGLLGERWIVDAETDTTGWTTGDKLNYAIPSISYVQQKISASGRYDLNSGHYYNTNAENDAHSWLNSEVKGNGIVTRTSTNGVVGERMIFEEGDIDFYHEENLNENQMAIQDISIPTVAAVVEMIGEFSQNKKTCYEYKPGMPETDENCWLWEFQ